MKRTTFLMLTLGSASLATNVHAQNLSREFYLNVDAGASLAQDLNIKGGQTIEFDPGARFGLGLGWQFSKPLSLEFETGFTFNSVDKIGGLEVSSYGGSADVYQVPMLVNLVYSVPTKTKFKPFVGAGVGGIATVADIQTPLGDVNDTDFTFGYQAILGAKWELSPKAELGLSYKFMGSLDHKWSSEGVTLETDAMLSHSILLSFTWKF